MASKFGGVAVGKTSQFGGVSVDQDTVEQAEPTFLERVNRQLGRTARIGIDAVAAFPLTAMDAGVAVRNYALDESTQLPSQTFKTEMDKVLPGPEGVTENIVDVVGQIGAGSRTIPNIGIKTPAPVSKGVDTAQEVIKEGVKRDVPVFYDDVGGVISKKIGTATENIPLVGTAGGRAAQSQAVNKATQKLVDDFHIDGDIPELVQTGLQNKLKGFKSTVGKLYDKASTILNPRGEVPTKSFDDAILKEMEQVERLGTAANPEVAKILDKYASAPRGDFSLMRELRSQLGSEVSDFYKGGSAIGEKGVGAVQAIKNALETDMGKFADDAGGAAKIAWRKADSFYKKGVVQFKETGLRQLVKSPEPEKAWRFLVSQGAKSRAERLYKGLDGEGRSAVRSGLIKEAVEKATTPKGDISPAKFAGYMERQQEAINTFFKGNDLREIEGFQRLMRHVERAGQFAENPPTGNRVVPFLLGGAAVVSPEAVVGIGAVAGTIKLLFQTKAGRDALIAASRFKPGSDEMTKLSKYLSATVSTQSK